MVEEAIASDSPGLVQVLFQPRQGLSYARNTGSRASRGPIGGFLDDDGVPVSTWVRETKRAFDRAPEGGLHRRPGAANWTTPRPSWLTHAHAGPVALQDRPHVQWVIVRARLRARSRRMAIRRAVFAEIRVSRKLSTQSGSRVRDADVARRQGRGVRADGWTWWSHLAGAVDQALSPQMGGDNRPVSCAAPLQGYRRC